MNPRNAAYLLAAIIAARASAYLFSKLLLLEMGPFTLMGERFLIAFALLSLIFWKRYRAIDKRTAIAGFAMGLAFFATMACELHALVYAPSTSVSFLENTAIVIVPLAEAALAFKVPKPVAIACALLALTGVGLLTLSTGLGSIGVGELLALGAAVFYAATMIITARFAKSGDTLLMGIMQIGWIGAFGMACGFAFETPVLPSSPLEWSYLAFLVVICTGFGFTLQPVVQRHLPTERVSMMCALNPLVACVLGVLMLGEHLSVQALAGAVLILAAILISSRQKGEGTTATPAAKRAAKLPVKA